MGKRTSSSGRMKSGTSSKGKSKSDALVYASKIEALAQGAKKLEERVRTDIDRVSEDIGQLVAHEIDVGTAPKDLEKARASSDKKEYKAARGHLDRASASLMKATQPQVEKRIADAQARINAVERLGIVEADLGEQLGDARKLVKKGWFLPALESAEAAAKRAVELAQNQLTEVVRYSEMNIKTAEKEGLDVYKSQEYLEMARKAVSDGDYEAAVEHTLLVQTSLDRARKGLTIDADSEGITIEDIVGEEDREYVEEIIRKGLDRLETDLGTLEEIRGLVSHPENMASKAKKALEDGNLGPARKLLREAHLATIRALRERLQDVLNAATERMKKAKRDGLNLQEIRSLHDQAIMKVDAYEFKDAYDAAMSIEERITKVKEEKEEIETSISEGEELIVELSELGTNESRAEDLLEQARKNLDRGDFKKARLNIAKALSTAKTSTQTFINSYIIEVRNVLLSVRTVGGNISTARPMLITAKKEMNKKAYAKAVELVDDSIMTIKGVDQEYIDTLREIMKSKYNYTLADSLNLNVTEVSEPMNLAFQELKNKNYDKAIKLAQKADFEIEIITEDSKTTSEDLGNAKEAINEGKKVGADVAEADFLLSKAITQIEKNNFEVAQELLTDAISAAEKARSDRVGKLLEDARGVVGEEESKGVVVDAGKDLLKDAEQAYKRADYGSTIDMINEAIKVILESSRRQEYAQNEITQAVDLLEETSKYAEANPLAIDYISTARNLLAGGQYPDAYDVARQAIIDLESSLVRYIDLIMEDTKAEISKAEEAGALVPKARDSYKLARRYLDKQDSFTALGLVRKASTIARETLGIYQEVMENIDLLDSYIQWGKRVSRHLNMPADELEKANGFVKEKKFSEAKTVVEGAIEVARQVQVGFVNDELESVDVFLKELEVSGVGTSVARNTLNQAHNSLSDMNFEQAYTLASQGREQGVKNQELYHEINDKRLKGSERLELAKNLGVDAGPLEEILDKIEKALINQTYTFALDFVDQLLSELPKATQVYINRRFNETNDLLSDSKDKGLIVNDQESLLDKAKEVAVAGELEATVETLDRLMTELTSIRERHTEAHSALGHLAEVLEAAEEIGVVTTGPRSLEASAAGALVSNEWKAVHRIVAEAEDELIRTSSSFIVDYIKRVQITLEHLERGGAIVTPVENNVDLAWNQLDEQRFTDAFATARDCTLTLQRIDEHFDTINDDLRQAEITVSRMGFLEVDTGDSVAVIGKAHEALTGLDFDSAERHISEALDELSHAIKGTAHAQIIELEAMVETVETEGADVSSARERLDRARYLLDHRAYQAGFLMTLDGLEAIERARREMDNAVEGRRRAEDMFKDTESLGADITRSKELLDEIDDDLKVKRYKDVLHGVRRLSLETGKAKNDHVLNLLTEGQNAIIEAEELGLSVKVLRGELEQAEAQLSDRDFHAAAGTSQSSIDATRDLVRRFITARDRIVEIQSFIYDASGIGTNTGRSTDMLGEARDALAEQRLEEAIELADRAETEVNERQKEMVGFEMEALEDLREEAREQGMVVTPVETALAQATEMTDAVDHKASILRLREGIEEGRELLVKFQVAQEAITAAEDLVTIMIELEIDSGVPTAEMERAKRHIPEQEYDQAKEVANVVTGDVVRILDEHVNQRVEALTASFGRAEDVGIQISDVQRSFDEVITQVDRSQYLEVTSIISEHSDRVRERTSAYDDALSRIEEAEAIFQDAEDLHVDTSAAKPVIESAREALTAGIYNDAASRADSSKEQVLALQSQFVDKYIQDAQEIISELQNMGVDTIQAKDRLEQAKAALDIEEYPSAHGYAVDAIKESQRVKDQFNEAKGLIEEAKKTLERATSLSIDIATAEEPLEQAIDSLEFQSYEEARDFAIESRQKAGRLMKEHVEASLMDLRKDIDVAMSEGIELSKGMQVVELAQEHLSEEMYIESQDAVDVGREFLDKRNKLHGRTDEVHTTVFEELENAETLGVEVSIYESDVLRFRQFYEDKDYSQAIPWGVSLLERLGADERNIMDLYIGEVTDMFDSMMDSGGIPKAPIENLDKSMDSFLGSDYIRSYNFVTRAREGIESESRAMEASKVDLEKCHQTIVWAEGMGVSVDEARVDFDRGVALLESSEYTQSLEAVVNGTKKAMESVAQTASDTLDIAERRATEVHEAGANANTVLDRVKRGQRSLEQEDYGYSLMFAQLALSAANKAQDDLKEAKEASEKVREEVEQARRILEDASKPEAFYSAILESLEARHISETLRLCKEAILSITNQERTAIQHRIDKVHDNIRLMEEMKLDGSSLEARLGDARDELAAGRYVDAITIVEDVQEPVFGLMEDRARTTLEDVKEAVEDMRTVGADDAEVVQGLNQTQDLFSANDFYHSTELSARTAFRAREISDLTVGSIIADIKALMEEADRLGVETGELDRRVEKVERHRTNARYVEAKEALDDLAKDVDHAQRELVEGIIETCDKLSILANERELDAGEGPNNLEEAHHFLSLKNYKKALETARTSFTVFEELFTGVVRRTLQDAKDLLINLDVSADIESSSDHYVKAEEFLERRDYVSAMANADAAMANARVIQVHIIDDILTAVDVELERGKGMEADMGTAADMAGQARDELVAGNLEDAQTMAQNAREEARNLMQAHATTFIQAARLAVESVPFEIEIEDIRDLLESASASLESADFETAADAAIQADKILISRLEEIVTVTIATAEEDLERGKEVGIDLSSPKEHLKDAKVHLEERTYHEGRAEAQKCIDLVAELIVKHKQAQEALSELMELVERATRARAKLSESMDMQEAAEDAMDEHGYDRVIELVELAITEANRSYKARVEEAISTADSTLKTLESMGANAKLAEDLLGEARRALESDDMDGAYDYADQSIKEAETAKTSFRDIIDITFQAESLIGTAKGFGMEVAEAQSRFDEALATRSEDVNRALALAEEAKSIATGLVDSFFPEIEVAMEMESALILDKWTNANLMIRNDGSARALHTTIEMSGNLDVDGLSEINLLRGSGKEKKMPIRLKPLKSGEIMVRIWIHCEREYDDNPYDFYDVRWLLADEEEGEEEEAEPGAQFLRKELTCTICQGKIGTQDAPRACSCGATFHQDCSEQLTDCPNCGKSLGGA